MSRSLRSRRSRYCARPSRGFISFLTGVSSYAGCLKPIPPLPALPATPAPTTRVPRCRHACSTYFPPSSRTRRLALGGHSCIFPQIERLCGNECEIRLTPVRIHRRQFFPPVSAPDIEKTFRRKLKRAGFGRFRKRQQTLVAGADDLYRDILFLDRAQIHVGSDFIIPARRADSAHLDAWCFRGTAARPAAAANCWRCC